MGMERCGGDKITDLSIKVVSRKGATLLRTGFLLPETTLPLGSSQADQARAAGNTMRRRVGAAIGGSYSGRADL